MRHASVRQLMFFAGARRLEAAHPDRREQLDAPRRAAARVQRWTVSDSSGVGTEALDRVGIAINPAAGAPALGL